MLGLNRWEEPHFDRDPNTPEMMQLLFDFIQDSGLTRSQIKRVIRDEDDYYHNEIRKPDYIDDAKMEKARDLVWEESYE